MHYLARYTHRVAITNNRLLGFNETHVSFRWKKHRQGGRHKNKVMRIEIAEFMRRFLRHVLANGFHRIRHYGFLANGHRPDKLTLCQILLTVPSGLVDRHEKDARDPSNPKHEPAPCPCCGGRLQIIETFDGSLCRLYPARRLDGL